MSRRRHAVRGGASRALLILVLLLAVGGAGAGGIYLWANSGGGGPQRPVVVTIPAGSSAGDIAELLEASDVVRSATAFKLKVGGTLIQAGTYDLTTNMSPDEALEALRAGPRFETIRVTIPEGLRVEQVADRLAESLGIDPEAFREAATSGDHALPPYLPEKARTVEGFLFPKTYDFAEDAGPEEVIGTLLAQFETEAAALEWGRAKDLRLSPYEIVIVASLVEREAGIDADRAKIASVIYNRIRAGMLLQIDATVQYALPQHKPRLTYEDYGYPSPYNTYLHEGLPPTPIASPGTESLRAALDPAETEFLFYLVVDPETREHGFARTYEEFLAMKDRIQG